LKNFLARLVSEFEKFCVFEVEVGWRGVVVGACLAVTKETVLLEKLCLSFGFGLFDETCSGKIGKPLRFEREKLLPKQTLESLLVAVEKL
jgi:hypothetical protein